MSYSPSFFHSVFPGMPLALRQGGGVGIVISASSIAENAANGTTIGNLSVVGGTGAYTFSKTADPDSKFSLTVAALKKNAAMDYETATSHSVTIHADNGAGSVLDRTFSIGVTNVLEVTLNAITLDDAAFLTADAPGTVIGAILGKTSGSTLVLLDSAGAKAAISGSNLVVGATAASAGSFNITFRETHPDAATVDTTISLTASAASAPAAFTAGQWTCTDMTIGGTLRYVFSATPSLNGAPAILDIEIYINSAWESTGLTGTGTYDRIGLTDDVAQPTKVRLRTAGGTGPDSDVKTRTPTTAAAVPVNSVAPVISGTNLASGSLSCSTGTWSNSPTGYAYQWQRNGVDISGATSSTLTGYSGAAITCKVTASNAGGAGSPATSNSLPIYVYFDDFSSDTSAQWTDPFATVAFSVSGGRLVGTSISGFGNGYRTQAMVSGRSYRFIGTLINDVSGTTFPQLRLGSSQNSNVYGQLDTTYSSPITVDFTAGGTTLYMSPNVGGNTGAASGFDNLSLMDIT